ncbi:hypothetical protein LTR27_007064 [Elasticomyces elasticus]|nr:hypothetical protein LTR27_007064 [Elasticomyces elasticus]
MDFVSVTHSQRNPHKVEDEDLGPSDHNSKRCHLLEIPPELRVRIYELAYENLGLPRTVFFSVKPEGHMCKSFTWRRQQPSETPTSAPCRKECRTQFSSIPLLKVCRLITMEATPVLYKIMTVTVQFFTWDSVDDGPILSPAVYDRFFAQVKNLAVHVCALNLEDVKRTFRLTPIVFGPAPRSKTIKEVGIIFNYWYAGWD